MGQSSDACVKMTFVSASLMTLSPPLLANTWALETLTKGRNALSLFVSKVTPESDTDKRVRDWFLFAEILNEYIDIRAQSRIYASEYGLQRGSKPPEFSNQIC